MRIVRIKGFSFSLPRVVTVCACCFFLVSVLFPFLTVPYYSIIPEDAYRITYWSYKATIKYLNLGYLRKSETFLFDTYWFAQQKPYSYPTPSTLGVSWILVVIFLTQILTLGFGFVALFRHWRSGQFLPLASGFSVTFLMVYMLAQIGGQICDLSKYEVGYWFSFSSAVLFLCALILRRRHVG